MLDKSQLRLINLKALLVNNINKQESLDIDLIKEFLLLEGFESEVGQIDEFFSFALNMLKNNEVKEIVNSLEIFKALIDNDNIANFYNSFLYIVLNDSPDALITDRMNLLLELEDIELNSEVYQLYLYNLLNLALACSPIDLELVNKLNSELLGLV